MTISTVTAAVTTAITLGERDIAGGTGQSDTGNGKGGNGAELSGGHFDHAGLVEGGVGGVGSGPGTGGLGGTGLPIKGGTLIGSGVITAGTACRGAYDLQGYGGAGVYLGRGSLVTDGTISGGQSPEFSPDMGDAVRFGSLAATLIIDPGAVFNGTVTANSSPDDNLQVAGSTEARADGQTIEGFASGGSITLDGFAATHDIYAAGTGLELSHASSTETLKIASTFNPHDFVVTDDGTDTIITLCYLRGTRILTPTGEIPIENLRINDHVVTRFNGIRMVKWIGRQTFDRQALRDEASLQPVHIRAGALGENQPARDLFVTPSHAMLLENILVPANALLNGVTITRDLPANHTGTIDFYQLDLGIHDCIIAEGTWSETFADGPGLRDLFHNEVEFYTLYPESAPAQELALCAARPNRGPALQAALEPVAARAAALVTPGALEGWLDSITAHCRIEGWAQDLANPELPVLLEILMDDQVIGKVLASDFRADLLQAGKGNGRCAFTFTTPTRLKPVDILSLSARRATDSAPLAMSDAWQAACDSAIPPLSEPFDD